MARRCQEIAVVGPHLFPPPRGAGEDQGGGLNDLNDWNVWNGSADDIDRGGIPNLDQTETTPSSERLTLPSEYGEQ